MGQTDEDDTLDFIDQAIARVADVQRSGIERIETKATFLIGIVVTATPLYAALFASRHAEHYGTVRERNGVFILLAVAALAAFWTIWPYRSGEAPDPKDFANAYFAAPGPHAIVARILIAQRVKNFEANKSVAKWKAVGAWIAFVALLAAAALSAWSLLR